MSRKRAKSDCSDQPAEPTHYSMPGFGLVIPNGTCLQFDREVHIRVQPVVVEIPEEHCERPGYWILPRREA